ncbi:MAG: hypothetical protein GY870_20600, partial [archaeon]|nr:hypothetical protein [archaeon]
MALPAPGTSIIVDIGSAYVKVGFAGESGPRFVFPCMTGTEKYKAVMADVSTRSIYVGDDAMKMRGVLKVSHPIQRGVIMNWEEYYEILNHIFYSLLRIEDLSQYPIFYVEPLFIPRETKEYIARVLFETHKVPSLIMIPSPILSLFSVGLTTGLVVESGHGITSIVPIINGQIYHQAVQKLNLAGFDVITNLKTLLLREGINISSSAVDEILREITEKNCYFVLNPNNPPQNLMSFGYPMPDGTTISIPPHVLYQSLEVLFQPATINSNLPGLPQATINSLYNVNSSYWSELLSHIVISGGNLSYPGFEERFKTDLSALLPQLGPIPKPQVEKPILEIQKEELQAVLNEEKKQDTCSQCGALVDLTAGKEHCPSCGARVKIPQISLDLGLGNTKTPKIKQGICPFCQKDIKDSNSVFCPYCGKNIETFELPEIPDTLIMQNGPAQEFS